MISLPISATVADYLDVPALYDQIPGGFAISDTASAIAANIASLNDLHITSITATAGTVTVSCAAYLANVATLDKVVGGFAISDTAADISADLDQLTDAKITSIAISDNAAVGVTVAQLTGDATQIGKLANANATPYQLAVTDTAANIAAGLNGLNGSSIGSITISDNGAIGVTVAQLTSDATAIGKLANANATPYQLAISDTAADITAALDSLNGSNIASITISDNARDRRHGGAADQRRDGDRQARQRQRDGLPARGDRYRGRHFRGARFAQRLAHRLDHHLRQWRRSARTWRSSRATRSAIGKLANANATLYQLAMTDTASKVTAALATLQTDVAHIASITVTGRPITVSKATIVADKAALDKIAGG